MADYTPVLELVRSPTDLLEISAIGIWLGRNVALPVFEETTAFESSCDRLGDFNRIKFADVMIALVIRLTSPQRGSNPFEDSWTELVA